jgi:hypothetical protein
MSEFESESVDVCTNRVNLHQVEMLATLESIGLRKPGIRGERIGVDQPSHQDALPTIRGFPNLRGGYIAEGSMLFST